MAFNFSLIMQGKDESCSKGEMRQLLIENNNKLKKLVTKFISYLKRLIIFNLKALYAIAKILICSICMLIEFQALNDNSTNTVLVRRSRISNFYGLLFTLRINFKIT